MLKFSQSNFKKYYAHCTVPLHTFYIIRSVYVLCFMSDELVWSECDWIFTKKGLRTYVSFLFRYVITAKMSVSLGSSIGVILMVFSGCEHSNWALHMHLSFV